VILEKKTVNFIDPTTAVYIQWLKDRGQIWPMLSQSQGAFEQDRSARTQALISSLDAIGESVSQCKMCDFSSVDRPVQLGEVTSNICVVFLGDIQTEDAVNNKMPISVVEAALLQRMLTAMKLGSGEWYFTNLILCPPKTGQPYTFEKVDSCRTYIDEIILAISPKIIVTFGAIASRFFLNSDKPFDQLRGKEHRLDCFPEIAIVPTFHPRDLLRFAPNKRLAWQDLQDRSTGKLPLHETRRCRHRPSGWCVKGMQPAGSRPDPKLPPPPDALVGCQGGNPAQRDAPCRH